MFVSPMLLERVPEPFDSTDYVCELKMDGIRLLLSKFDDKIRLYTRHNNEVTSLFPELYSDFDVPNGTVIDGELIVPGQEGKPDFEAVMERFKSKKSRHKIQYVVFDIIFYKGEKVAALPLLERKKLLGELDFGSNVVPVQWIEGEYSIKYFELIKQNDLEGIVLKDKYSKYEINKRSNKWLKVINYKSKDVLITGLLKKEQSFLLSTLDGSQNIGVMEFVPVAERKKIYREIEKQGTTENDKVILFNQGIKCNVKFRNWTSKGKLRIPSFNTFIS